MTTRYRFRVFLAATLSLAWFACATSSETLSSGPKSAAGVLPGKGKTIKPARGDWDTGWFQTEIFRQLLEKLGYSVGPVQSMNDPAFYKAVAQGAVDFWADGWFPNSDSKVNAIQDKVEVLGYVVKAGALQGYLIDKSTAQKYRIANLGDLSRPEIARLFDMDGDARADLIGCNVDWTCADVINHHLKAYELNRTVEQVQGNYDALMKQINERYRKGQAVLFYTWTPNWTVGQLIPGEDVIWLEVPFASLPAEQKAKESLTRVSGVEGCREPCDLGWPPNDIRVVANREFLKTNPAARRLFELVKIPLNDISRQNARMFGGEKKPEDIQRHAREWMETHPKEIQSWLDEARRAAAG